MAKTLEINRSFKVSNPIRCRLCGNAMIASANGQIAPEHTKVEYKMLLIDALDFPPQGGLLPKTMRERNNVAMKIETSKNGTVELENAEFDILYQTVQIMPMRVRDKGFEEFYDYLDEVKAQKPQ